MLIGNQVYLRPLQMADVTDEYVSWMNDYEIVKYTESRFVAHTYQSIKDFVRKANTSDTHTFAIIAKDTEKHIGNIKLGGINEHHRFGDIGLIIGHEEYFGRGIGTECICLVTDFAFNTIRLHKVWCGIYENNISSIRAFEKAGWEKYATDLNKCLFEGSYINCLLYHKINVSG